MERPRVLILGKVPPPLMGPAIATKIILDSDLNDTFELFHFDTRINSTVAEMGSLKWSKISAIRKKYKGFKKMLNEVNPEIVLVPISQTTMGFFKDVPFLRMSRKSGAKVLVQLRGSAFRTWYERLNKFMKRRVVKGLSNADGAIVLGENLRPIFSEFFSDQQIFVVPNGGDYSFPERKNHALRLTYLANYLPGKGLLELLKALNILAQSPDTPSFEFHAFGSWDSEVYESECRALLDAPEMKHCHLHTSVYEDEKWQALADSDIFVFAPRSPEGHPWSLVEATAAGLPIVSTDRGAIRQSVVHAENGFLLKNPIPGELAASIVELLSNPLLRKHMGEASRKLYESEFTASAMTAKLGNVFHQISGR